MPQVRIYIAPDKIRQNLEISERQVVHKIKDVLRIKTGASINVFDGQGKEYCYNLQEIQKNTIFLKKDKLIRSQACQKNKIILGFPLLKEEKIDFILQKATELGTTEFIPYICERSLNIKPSIPRLLRWKKIINEAARQSEQLWLAKLHESLALSELTQINFQLKLAGSIKGGNINNLINANSKEVLLVVGPEGDFSPREYRLLSDKGFKFIKYSENILRTETAAIFGIGLVGYFLYADSHRLETSRLRRDSPK